MAGGQTSGAVTDWQTVAEPNDWQTVTETANPLTANPKSEGLYSVKKGNQTIKVPFSQIQSAATQGYELTPEDSDRYAKDASYAAKGAPNSVVGGFGREAVAIPKGILRTLTTNPLTTARGFVQSGINAGKQAVQQAKDAYALPPGNKALKSLGYARAATTGLSVLDPFATGTVVRNNQLEDEGRSREAVGESIPDLLLLGAGTKVGNDAVAAPVKAASRGIAKFLPRTAEVAGENIPVTVGEAEPESAAGRTQSSLKRSGAGAPKFEEVEKAQQEGAKNAIKNTARRASGFVGPMQEEAGSVVDDAATASFAKAKPLYEDLDKSLVQIPDGLQNVSKIVQDAAARAKKLGVDIESEDIGKIHPDKEGAIQFGGSKISRISHPDIWQKLVDDGIIDESGNATPLRAYRQVRSQLLKMQRSATDGATRYAIGNEVKAMDANINAALKGTGLEGTWTEANRLWREGKARIEVAQAVKDATKGTPESAQAAGLSKVPTKLQGASLVDKLNTLADDGTLQDAFTPDQVKNLRASADILDRIQRTPVGKGSGESVSLSRGLTHALRGNIGPLAGAATGAMIGGIHGAEYGAGLGFVAQRIGEQGLIRVMTRTDGVTALRSLEMAKTAAEQSKAVARIISLAAQPRKPVAAALGGRKYTHTATNPQGHRIGSHDGQTWYDHETGQQVQ